MSSFGAALVIARPGPPFAQRRLNRTIDGKRTRFRRGRFPHANKFTIHILAAVAERECQFQSERMKVVFAALKQRGIEVENI